MIDRFNLRNTDNQFAGDFVQNTAQMEWSAHEANFDFQSDPINTSASVFAVVGHERNGVFFPNV